MSKVKKFAAISLAALMTVGGLTGCSTEQKVDGTKTVMTVGDEKVSLGTYMSMLRFQQAATYDYYKSMEQMYASSGYTVSMTDNMFNRDATSSSDDSKSEAETSGMTVKTAGDSLADNIAVALANYVTLEQKAKDYNVSITDDEKSSIEKAAKAFMKDSDSDSIKKNGITQSDVEKMLTYYTYYTKVYDEYSKQAKVTVTDDETKSMTVSYVQFAASSDSSDSDKDSDSKIKKAAEDFLKKCQDDKNYAKDMESKAGDTDNATFNSTSMAVNNDEEDAYVFTVDQMKKIVETENGAMYGEVVKDSNGNYYVVRMDNNNDKDAAATYAETLKKNKIDEVFNKDLKSWKKDIGVKYEKSVLNNIEVTDNVLYTGTKDSDSSTESTDSSSTTDSATSTESSTSTESTTESTDK